MRTRLGWLGPAIVVVALVAGAVLAWWSTGARPMPGPYVELLALDDDWAVAVRSQQGSERSFVELVEIGKPARWQAHIPHYAGTPDAPGLSATPLVVTVRVVRDGRPEVFALGTANAVKVNNVRLASEWAASPTAYGLAGVMTVPGVDGGDSYEVFGDDRRGVIVAMSGINAVPRWRRELDQPIRNVVRDDRGLRVDVAGGSIRIDPATGAVGAREPTPPSTAAMAPYSYVAQTRILARTDPTTGTKVSVRLPEGALPPRTQHRSASRLWLVLPDRVATLDATSLEVVKTSDGAPLRLEKVD